MVRLYIQTVKPANYKGHVPCQRSLHKGTGTLDKPPNRVIAETPYCVNALLGSCRQHTLYIVSDHDNNVNFDLLMHDNNNHYTASIII